MVIGTLKIIEESRIAREAMGLQRLAVVFSASLRSSGATPLPYCPTIGSNQIKPIKRLRDDSS